MPDNLRRRGMDGRRNGDVRVSNFDFESASENMDVVDPNLILEVPDTPDRLAMRRTVAASSKTYWEGNICRLDAKPNRDPARRTYVTCSRYPNHRSSVGSSNASDDTKFFFAEAKLARQLSTTMETKPSLQHQSKTQELSCARISNGIVRSRETVDLSSKIPLTDSDPTSFLDPGWKNVETLNENRIILLPSDVNDMKIEGRHGDTAGLRSRDKGKGIDVCGDAKIRNNYISSCHEGNANFTSEIGSQNVSNSVDRASDQINGIRKQLCRDSELINGQPHRQRKLVRNGCISPLNIERSRHSMKQKEVEDRNNWSPCHQVHVISPDSQDRHCDKMKGKVAVEDIVAASEQSVKDRSHSSSSRLGKEVTATTDQGGDGCSFERFEDNGWRTTRNHMRKSSTVPTSMSGGSSRHTSNRSFVNALYVDPEVTDLQHETDPFLLQDFQELQMENGGINGKRKHGSSHFPVGECSSSISSNHRSLNFGSSRQPSNCRSTRSRRSQRDGLVPGPITEVDELQSPEATSSSVVQDRQVESDEMLARLLQEELYNEPLRVGNTEVIDASMAMLLQENDRRVAAIARRHPSRRRDLSSSSTRPRLRETLVARAPTSSRMAQLRRNFQRSMMDLNMRLDIIGEVFSGDDDTTRVNNILHIQRDFNEDDYEMLLALDENNHQHGGASESQINNLPQSIMQEHNVNSQEACAVCLEPPAVGDSIRHLPCLHKFHKDCIDAWLRRKRSCPICKSDIR